jgi:uncharacterized protein YraI
VLHGFSGGETRGEGILKVIVRFVVTCLAVGSLAGVPTVQAVEEEVWGETIGPVSAVVDKGEGKWGMAVRSRPSPDARILTNLSVGTKIKGYREFYRGWMQIQSPVDKGWVRIDSLRPRSGEGTVKSVDRPEMCLRIRRGPSLYHPVVGCARRSSKLKLTGLWSEDNWAQVERPVRGWVYARQIASALSPRPGPSTALAGNMPPSDRPSGVYEPGWPRPGDNAYRQPPSPRRYPGPPPRARAYPRYGARYYGIPGYGVRIAPRGGVSVKAGPVNVGVSPLGSVGVNVPGFDLRLGSGRGLSLWVGPWGP